MTTTMSSSNPASGARPMPRRRGRYAGLFLSVLRRNLGMTIFYFIVQFLFFPLQYILTALDYFRRIAGGTRPEDLEYYFYGIGGILTDLSATVLFGMMLLVPILFSLIQYSYLHQKKSTDLFHTLPVERPKMLLLNFAASCVMILGPFLLNWLIACIAAAAFGAGSFSLTGSLVMLLVYSVSTLATLAVAALCAVSTGTVFDNFLYTCGTLYALPVVYVACLMMMDQTLTGSHFSQFSRLSYFLSPGTLLFFLLEIFDSDYFARTAVGRRFALQGENFFQLTIGTVIWLAVAAAVLTLAVWVYNRRKSELAGRTGYNNAIAVALKLAASFVGGIFFSQLFSVDLQFDALGLLFSVIGAALVYCVLECVMSRGFKTLRHAVPIVAAGAALPFVFLLVLYTGGFGFETRIPAADAVESVEIAYTDRYNITRYNLDAIRDRRYNGEDFYSRGVTLTSAEDIELMRSLHRTLIDADSAADTPYVRDLFKLTYHLKNGGKLNRRYTQLGPGTGNEIYDRLNVSDEVIRQLHPVFTFEAEDIRCVTLLSPLMTDIDPLDLTPEQIGALIEALRGDLLAETYEQMQTAKPIGFISMTPMRGSKFYDDRTAPEFQPPEGAYDFADCYALVTEAYTSTLALLRDFGADRFGSIDYSRINGVYARLNGLDRNDWGSTDRTILNAPTEFNPDTYRADNYGLKQIMATYAAYADPAEQRQLLDLVRINTSEAMIPLEFGSVRKPFSEVARLEIYISTVDGSNLARPLYINPQSLSAPMFERLRETFEHEYSASYMDDGGALHEDLFDQVVKAVRSADGSLCPDESRGTRTTVLMNADAAVG